MKIIITESRRDSLALNWLEKDYSELKKIKFPGHEEIFVSDKGMFKLSYSSRTKSLYVKDNIWDFIHTVFGYDNDEVGELLLGWGNKKFGFRAKKCHRVEQI